MSGRRFTAEVLEYRLAGKGEVADANIAEVLAMSVDQAWDFFRTGTARTVLGRLRDVGLGYITLGQPLTTLSGGERQRLKLAIQMAGSASVFVLDEPTTGPHMADVDQLVDDGHSVIVIEHHLAVVAHADWAVELGPGAWHAGGRVVFTGTPTEPAASRTLTGQHLAKYVG